VILFIGGLILFPFYLKLLLVLLNFLFEAGYLIGARLGIFQCFKFTDNLIAFALFGFKLFELVLQCDYFEPELFGVIHTQKEAQPGGRTQLPEGKKFSPGALYLKIGLQ